MSTSADTPGAGGPAESIPGAAFDLADLDNDVVLPRVRRKRLPLLTALLAVSVVAGVGVVGGILIQKHWGGSSAAGGAGGGGAAGRNFAAFAALRGGGPAGATAGAGSATGATANGPGGGRGFGGGFGGTAGTVKAIDGTTLYVTDTTGNIVKVTTTPALTVRVTKNGTLQDVKPGDSVVVIGQATGGVVAATAITEGATGGGFGGFGRGGAGGGATGSANGSGTTGSGASQPPLPGLGG